MDGYCAAHDRYFRLAAARAVVEPAIAVCTQHSACAACLTGRVLAAVLLLAGLVTLAIYHLGGELYAPLGEYGYFHAGRNALLGSTIAALLLAYFRLRAQALSPALQESRLQALHARIRPHFLFNSINAVLGIVRADPKRAETALEDMSDLFPHGDGIQRRFGSRSAGSGTCAPVPRAGTIAFGRASQGELAHGRHAGGCAAAAADIATAAGKCRVSRH